MAEKIAITGANGTVGTVLAEKLKDRYDIVPLDLPQIDVADRDALKKGIAGVDTIIHLAGIYGIRAENKENWLWERIDPRNREIFDSVMETAISEGVKQFIHASSVHAEPSLEYMLAGKKFPKPVPGTYLEATPSSGYGLGKRGQELALADRAHQFVDGAVSIRIGGVSPANKPGTLSTEERTEHERRVWLDHEDLAALVGRILDAPRPGEYDIVYAVSNNRDKFHDTSNNFDWAPTSH